MKMSKAGREWLTELEGSSSKAYKDVAGNLTIGVGHLLTQDELSSGRILIDGQYISYGVELTAAQVDSILSRDLNNFEYVVNYSVDVDLTQNQFEALVSFAFNVGSEAFMSSTLLKVLNLKNYAEVPHQLRRWKYSGGKVVKGLINRREKEIDRWNAGDSAESTTELSTEEQLEMAADAAERLNLAKAASVIRMITNLLGELEG